MTADGDAPVPDPPEAGEAKPPAAGPDPEQSTGPRLKSGGNSAFDEQATDAYEGGRRRFRPLGGSTFSSARDQSIHIGPRYELRLGTGGAPAPGPVPAPEIKDVRERYTPVPGYEKLRVSLQDSGLLVLAGTPRSGRSTTALRLLDGLTDGQVARLDAEAGLTNLDDESVQPQHGYLVVLPDATTLTRPQADRLADLCRSRTSYCVAVVDTGSRHVRILESYAADCLAPAPSQVLRAHLDAEIRADDPPRLAERLIGIATEAWLGTALGPAPRPGNIAAAAALLLQHGRGATSLAAVEAECARLLDAEVEVWFSALRGQVRGDRADRAIRLAAYRLALAVFDGLPQHVVFDAAEELADLLITTAAPLRKPGRPLVLDEPAALADALGADMVDGTVRYGSGSVPATLLQHRDSRLPVAVLTHVWRSHHNLRAPVGSWLERLGRDDRPAVRIRAGQATGLLCSVDFSYTFEAVVVPAALAAAPKGTQADTLPDPDEDSTGTWEQRRAFAAIALDQAAVDEELRETVEGILRRWRRADEPALRWTAALTLGYELGLRDIRRTLEELRVIGTPQEGKPLSVADDLDDDEVELIWVAGLSLAQLFLRGARRPVLDALAGWLGQRRRSLTLLVHQAVVIMAGLRVSAVAEARIRDSTVAGNDGTGAAPDAVTARPGSWPLLVAIAADEPHLAPPVAALVRETLRGPGRDFTTNAVTSWIRTAENDGELLGALARFLPSLVAQESDRARLRNLIAGLRRSWADPLSAGVADRLDAALASRKD